LARLRSDCIGRSGRGYRRGGIARAEHLREIPFEGPLGWFSIRPSRHASVMRL
jgi:hypothetical protein